MSFAFSLLLGIIFKPFIAAKYRFDNFDVFGYYAGFWLAGLPHLVRLLVGEVQYLTFYSHFFPVLYSLWLFPALAIFFRIYVGNWRESVFLLLPLFGILLNFATDLISPNPVFPSGFFFLEFAGFPLVPGYWVPVFFLACLLPFRKRLRSSFYRFSIVFVLLSFFAFHQISSLAVMAKMEEKHPRFSLVSAKPNSIFGGSLIMFGKLEDVYYYANAHVFSDIDIQPHDGINKHGVALNFLSFNSIISSFFFRLFYNPLITVENFPTKISIFFEETQESFSIFSNKKMKINVNQFNMIESVDCKRSLFGQLQLPC